MQISSEKLGDLLLKKLLQQLSTDEAMLLEKWANQSEGHRAQLQEMTNRVKLQADYHLFVEAERRAAAAVPVRMDKSDVVRLSINKRNLLARWGWAAAVFILIGGAGYFVTQLSKSNDLIATNPTPLSSKIDAAYNKATLTLSDGTMIALDSIGNGAIATQGNAAIIKASDGGILYDVKGVGEDAPMINTMKTPNGGQFHLVLPDGTKVWMNAASSISYPAVFTGKERNVTVTGEVFFEVASNVKQPFRVQVQDAAIEVLGTSFNINAYTDEKFTRTTLVEGRVKVVVAGRAAILQPGQQASLTKNADNPINVNSDVNIEQTIAWKNGLFSFKDADLVSVMNQLKRWYDIQVQYEGPPPSVVLNGEMYRNASLSDVLTFLQRMGVKLRKEDKIVIIL